MAENVSQTPAPAVDVALPALAATFARRASFVVLAFAIGISGYLSYLKLSDTKAACLQGGTFDCGTVLNSSYSEIQGIPIAWLGLAVNLIVLGLLLLETRVGIVKRFGPPMIFGIVLFATIYSVYLVYVQAAIIGSYCPWCLTHEALIFVLFGLSLWRVVKWGSLNQQVSD